MCRKNGKSSRICTKRRRKGKGTLPDSEVQLKEGSEAEELTGKTAKQYEEDKLMSSVLENDKQTIDDGRLLNDAINQGMGSFTPDLIFEQLVKNYSLAENIIGPSIIRRLAGYDADYVKKNIRIPEFQRKLDENIRGSIEKLKEEGFLDDAGNISDKGVKLASLILYTEELDHIIPKGILGEKHHKKSFIYGSKEEYKNFSKGDRYRDIAIKKSAKVAIRRSHQDLQNDDLRTYERQSKGQICLIYGLDASGSMKGKKIEVCKKAGVALAYKAIQERDKVGLIVFGSDIKKFVNPTLDFRDLLESMTTVSASRETNIVKTIEKAVEMFPKEDMTKHLILLTDAMPTVGEKPEEETLEAASLARSNGITISLIGIKLDRKGRELGEKITQLGDGRLYLVKDLEDVDTIVLEDYYMVS